MQATVSFTIYLMNKEVYHMGSTIFQRLQSFMLSREIMKKFTNLSSQQF